MYTSITDSPLTLTTLLSHAEKYHSSTEVLSIEDRGRRQRGCWSDTAQRARIVSSALCTLDLQQGDRVATLALNNQGHLDLYYGISCSGFVCHTVNPRLFPDEIVYVLNHARARVLFLDPSFLALAVGHRHLFETIEHIFILGPKKNAFAVKMYGFEFAEDLFVKGDSTASWKTLDETMPAGLCYTSGTTGFPKGVLYSHRSMVVHASILCLPDQMCLSSKDTMLAVTPMYHVNGWGLPFATAMVGARLVLPGPFLDGRSLLTLINEEKVTVSIGVPTIWEEVLTVLHETGETLPTLQRIYVGGTAVPDWMTTVFRERYNVECIQCWGMTELCPLGTTSSPKNSQSEHTGAELDSIRQTQGRPHWGLQMKIVDQQGRQLVEDGVTAGDLWVKGPCVLRQYYLQDEPAQNSDGWFPTGDIGTIDSNGFLRLTDRAKDLVKSGGEWISSIRLEHIVCEHSGVHEAAVIGVYHPKWDERPVVVVELVPGQTVGESEILEIFGGRVAKWQVPDKVIFVDELPLGATGKPLKRELREEYMYCLHSPQEPNNG